MIDLIPPIKEEAQVAVSTRGAVSAEIVYIADLQNMAVAEWLQSFKSILGPMERLGII